MNVKQLVETEEKLNELIRKILQPRINQDTIRLANMPDIHTQKTGRDITQNDCNIIRELPKTLIEL